jgi:hypothetical protein
LIETVDVSIGMFSGAGFSESAMRNKRRMHSVAASFGGKSTNSLASSISFRANRTRIKSESCNAGLACLS